MSACQQSDRIGHNHKPEYFADAHKPASSDRSANLWWEIMSTGPRRQKNPHKTAANALQTWDSQHDKKL